MTDHVAKPVSPAELLAVLTKWVGSRALSAAAIPGRAPGAAGRPLPASLPGFDLEAALARTAADADALAAVLRRFARDFEAAADEMSRLVSAGEREQARRLAHRVKGSAGTVGAVDAAAAAAWLEDALRSGDGAEALPAFVTALRSAVQAVTAGVRPPATQQADAPPDPVVLAAAVDRLRRLLREHELVPAPLLADVCGHAAALGAGRLVDTLRAEIESFDYDRALGTLEAVGVALRAGGDGRHGG